MAIKLADARRSLLRAKESARQRLEALDNERREIKASLKSLDAALKALDRTSRPPATSPRTAAEQETGGDATIDVTGH